MTYHEYKMKWTKHQTIQEYNRCNADIQSDSLDQIIHVSGSQVYTTGDAKGGPIKTQNNKYIYHFFIYIYILK